MVDGMADQGLVVAPDALASRFMNGQTIALMGNHFG